MLRNLIIVSAFTLLGSVAAFGQIAFGVKGSLQLASIKFSGGGQSITTDNGIGFQAGLMLKAPISDQLSIRPQLLYSAKAFKLSSSAFGGSGETKATVNYLEVPIQLAYGFEVGDGNVVVGAGPYLAYGLGGQATTTVNGQTETQTIDFSDPDAQKRFDYGLTVSVGYELSSGLGLSAYYSPGLANLTNSASSASFSTKNTAFGVSVGYFFGN